MLDALVGTALISRRDLGLTDLKQPLTPHNEFKSQSTNSSSIRAVLKLIPSLPTAENW